MTRPWVNIVCQSDYLRPRAILFYTWPKLKLMLGKVPFDLWSKVLSIGNEKKNGLFFCISLAYSYFCPRKDINRPICGCANSAEVSSQIFSI